MTLTVLWSAKGGAGTSVVSACWALQTPSPSVLVDVDGDLPWLLGIPSPSGQGLCDWFESEAPPRAVLDLAIELDATTRLIPRGATKIAHRAPRWGELGRWLAASDLEFVADVGLGGPPLGFLPRDTVTDGRPPRARGLLVTRSCYIALNRAMSLGSKPDGIVFVDEPGHDLGDREIARALEAPVVAKIAWDPSIGRATDRGLLNGRLPKSVVKLSQRVA